MTASVSPSSSCASRVHASEIDYLVALLARLKSQGELQQKIAILDQEARVQRCQVDWAFSSLQEEWIVKSLWAIGQEKCMGVKKEEDLIATLLVVDTFYEEIGGLIGYHLTLLEFLHRPKPRFSMDKVTIHAPSGVDFSYPSVERTKAIYEAIQGMGRLGELYPIGGAADRLKLQDGKTGAGLPAALFSFNGRTLLGKLIEDLQAREYLYYKLKGEQITLPVAMMTSKEKDNHEHVQRLCEQNAWFHRPKEKFTFFCQPLVPVVDKTGNFVIISPGKILLKPGGHGVMWKLARDAKVFSWLREQGAEKVLVRQINNPISSEDYGLLAFAGQGLKEDKRFGFASCQRQVRASEGINVIVEQREEDGYSYALTNIEYCDFSTYDIQDEPAGIGKQYSKFPSNTNLLFADLASVEEALDRCPVPGMLVNVKSVSFLDGEQRKIEKEVARLESTMQNIADGLRRRLPRQLALEEHASLDTYITFNTRRKTISATKKEYAVGSSFLETPEGCFLDVMANTRELLEEYCQLELPAARDSFTHPCFLFRYHPALGPLYDVIGQKIRGGSLTLGSELELQIAECEIERLHLDGSLLVVAERVMGHKDEEGILRYSDRVGRCVLKNVTVHNTGVDYDGENVFWKRQVQRKESLKIYLEGESEFYAEDVTFKGALEIHVQHGYRVIAREVEGELNLTKEPLTFPSTWQYCFAPSQAIAITKAQPFHNCLQQEERTRPATAPTAMATK